MLITLINKWKESGTNYQSELLKTHDRNQTYNDVLVRSDPEPIFNNVIQLFKPLPIVPDLAPLSDLSEYEEVAKTLGFRPPELEARTLENARRELLGFMLDQGYPIYNNKEVHDYMAKLAEKDGKVFIWTRLDGVDAEAKRDYEMRMSVYTVRDNTHGQRTHFTYARPVPIDILKRASAVKKKFGKRVDIFVSDYAVVVPDPFVMATLDRSEHVVFGVWDEPGFAAIGRDAK